MAKTCPHVVEAGEVTPEARVCRACQQAGDAWVELRVCLTCGHVGCCDASKNKHASDHFEMTGHPIVAPLEETGPAGVAEADWYWCYIDEAYVDVEL